MRPGEPCPVPEVRRGQVSCVPCSPVRIPHTQSSCPSPRAAQSIAGQAREIPGAAMAVPRALHQVRCGFQDFPAAAGSGTVLTATFDLGRHLWEVLCLERGLWCCTSRAGRTE